MNRKVKLQLFLLLGLLALAGTAVAAAPPGQPPSPGADELAKPQWRIGDQWVVETVTRQIQAGGGGPALEAKPVRWQFAVRAVEKLAGADCYRVEVRLAGAQSPRPLAMFWVDRECLALRQVQMELRVAGQPVTVTESYHFASGQPSPVQGPLTALPIDMPAFSMGSTKGLHEFSYEAIAGAGGQKAIGDAGFAFDISQDVTEVKQDSVKGLLDDDFTKDLAPRPIVQVKLKTPVRQVRQFWRPDQPWPVYVENGPTVARLVKVIPAGQNSNQPEAHR